MLLLLASATADPSPLLHLSLVVKARVSAHQILAWHARLTWQVLRSARRLIQAAPIPCFIINPQQPGLRLLLVLLKWHRKLLATVPRLAPSPHVRKLVAHYFQLPDQHGVLQASFCAHDPFKAPPTRLWRIWDAFGVAGLTRMLWNSPLSAEC